MFQFRVDKLQRKLFVPPEAEFHVRWIACASYGKGTAHGTPRHLEQERFHLSVRQDSQKNGDMNRLWRY